MSVKICKSSVESEDVAHYCITEFLEREDSDQIVERGEGMKFLSGMIHRSFHSSSSPYHTIYRQKGRVHANGDNSSHQMDSRTVEEYDHWVDFTTEAILGILEEMKLENKDRWYEATLFEMWLDNPNYSQLSRKTQIPRTSISQAVNDCKEYIKEELKNRNIEI